MPRFTITFGTRGAPPVLPNTEPIELVNGAALVYENSLWRVRVEVTAADQKEAGGQARQFANSALALVQVFMVNMSNPFRFFVDDALAPSIIDSSGNTLTPTSIPLETGLSIFVNAPGNLEKSLADLSRLPQDLGTRREWKDCRLVLHYFASALKENDGLYRFLNYISAIEAMLSEPGETTEKICRRLAVLVSSRTEFRDMQSTFDSFKDYYNTRSDILHGKAIPNVSTQQVDDVAQLARIAVRNYLLLRSTLDQKVVKEKLDKFFDQVKIDEIRRDTAF